MAGRLRGNGQDNTSTHRFVAYSPANLVWNTSLSGGAGAYEAWNDAHFTDYDLPATRQGTTTTYVGDEPAGAAWFQLWYWTGTLASSYPVDSDVIAPAVNNAGQVEASNLGDGAQLVVTPFMSVVTNPRYQTRNCPPIAQGSSPTDIWIFVDVTGAPINLTNKTVRYVAFLETDPDGDTPYDEIQTPAFQYETGGGGITISGAGGNQASVAHDAIKTATPGDFHYFIWNITDNLPLAKGKCPVEPAVKSYP
jgi:hypothetical protein